MLSVNTFSKLLIAVVWRRPESGDSMAYAFCDSLYCACRIQRGARYCMLPAHDVRSCVEDLGLESLEVQLLESQPRKLEHNHNVPAAVLTLRSTHKFLAAVSWLNFPCAM